MKKSQNNGDTLQKKADIIIEDMPLLDTTASKNLLGTFISDLVLQLLSFVAENERQNIRIRQAEGIAAARKRGVQFGKPRIDMPEKFPQLYCLWENKEITIHEFADRCHAGRSTIYQRIKEYKENQKNFS